MGREDGGENQEQKSRLTDRQELGIVAKKRRKQRREVKQKVSETARGQQ